MVSDFTVNRSIEFEYKRIMKDAQKRQQEEITNAILIVAVLIILLIMAAGAEGIHESFRKNPLQLQQVLRIYRLVCSFLLLGVIIFVLVGLGAYGRLMARIPVGWLPGLMLGFILYLSGLARREIVPS